MVQDIGDSFVKSRIPVMTENIYFIGIVLLWITEMLGVMKGVCI